MGTDKTARLHFPFLVTVKVVSSHHHRSRVDLSLATDVGRVNFPGLDLQERNDDGRAIGGRGETLNVAVAKTGDVVGALQAQEAALARIREAAEERRQLKAMQEENAKAAAEVKL